MKDSEAVKLKCLWPNNSVLSSEDGVSIFMTLSDILGPTP